MKNYYQLQLRLTNQGQLIQGEDFGSKAALEHRIAKASLGDDKPHINPKTNIASASKFLGAGTFKNVFETPGRNGAPVDPSVSFVLAKLDCSSRASNEKEAWENAKDAVSDQVKTMLFYGQPQSSIYATFDKLSGFLSPRIYLYMPRVPGHNLKDLIRGNKGALDYNQRILYFLQLCRELKALHKAGYFHGDLKPANIMADPASGAALIDFGGVQRCWHPIGVHTRNYSIAKKNYADYFLQTLRTLRPSEYKASAANYNKGLNVVTRFFEDMNEELAQDKEDRNGYETRHRGGNVFVFGAAYDTAALTLIALELKLWNNQTRPLFIDLVSNYFRPAFLEPIIAHLSSEYTGQAPLNTPQKLRIVDSANGIDVLQSNRPGIEPSSIQYVIKNRYEKQLSEGVATGTLSLDQANESREHLRIVDLSFKLFQRFSAIKEIYKQSEVDSGKSVETKFHTLTSLINSLTYIHQKESLRTILTKIFAVSLVNRSIWNKSNTKSFGFLFRAAKEAEFLPLIREFFHYEITNETTEDTFRGWVIAAIGALTPIDNETSFKKDARYETISKILLDSSVPSLVPITRVQARAAATQFVEAKQMALKNELLTGNVALATLTLAGLPAKSSAQEWSSERQKLSGYVVDTFNELKGGYKNNQESQNFQRDIEEFYRYAPPS